MELAMKVLTSIVLVLFGTWTTCYANDAQKSTCERTQKPITTIINSLNCKLANQIEGKGNYFFSPLSVSVALALVYTGARGTTRNQMVTALQYKTVGKGCLSIEISKAFKDLLESLESKTDSFSFLVANAGFVQRGHAVLPEYTSKLLRYFKAQMLYLDFANEELASLNAINQWVSTSTNGKISKLLKEPLDPMTIMILLNAVYFKGLWKHPFQEKQTWNSFFYMRNGTSKLSPFMLLQQNVNYYDDPVSGHAFLELDYSEKNISMLLALPNEVSKFPDVEFNSETLCRVRSHLKMTEVVVVIPKFKLYYMRELSKDMIHFGMNELFSDRADLSGMREKNDLHVSLMIHKALVEVNEQGTVAAAISGVGIDARRGSSQQVTFWADHPFLFCILDKRSDVILFTGRVAEPIL